LLDLARPVPPADPELVLMFLSPADRTGRPADLEREVVLVSCADLADREAAGRPVVEAQEHRRKIFNLHVDEFEGVLSAAGREGLARCGRFPALTDDRGNLAEDLGDPKSAHVLRQIAPVRA